MKVLFTTLSILFVSVFCCVNVLKAQVTLRGNVADETGETLIGASVVVVGTTTGNTTDFDGNFELTVPAVPTKLVISYVGYASDTIIVEGANEPINVGLGDNATTMVAVEVKGRRISEKRQQSALTMETLDNIAIRETPAANFYDGLGSLKDVDLTSASIGFKIINTRGFNSTSPVRSLQIIDGVDNQSPGLNFSLGNFLGASELDVNAVNIIVGASSAFYGPNAFNGVISMETKDPFLHQGLSASVKLGEQNLFDAGIRYAQAFDNKEGKPLFAYKLNASGFQADDWVADNFDPVFETSSPFDNLGGFDGVNIYGDEFDSRLDFSSDAQNPFLGTVHRDGFTEGDLVDYDSENLKLSALAQFRLIPEKDFESPELVLATNYSTGTTIYQGDNRFALRDIQFYQHRIELKKRNNYFLRAFITHEDAGDSYDPFFTALQLRDSVASNSGWGQLYRNYWTREVQPQLNDLGQPSRFIFDNMGQIVIDPNTGRAITKDPETYQQELDVFRSANGAEIDQYHQEARDFANAGNINDDQFPRFEPGTARFDSAFNSITNRISSTEGGTRFFDRSALVHAHGEYQFNDLIQTEKIPDLDLRLGSSFRQYIPNSRGSILSDTNGVDIDTYEFGVYGGGSLSIPNNIKISFSARLDKHENFDYLFSPAASIVYTPTEETTFRLSFSSAIRNPTLADQYLLYNVGPAILLGNLNGRDSLITLESIEDFLNTTNPDTLDYFNVAPISPEQVRTFEAGVRTTLFKKLFLDATYYYSFYDDFIGFNLGVSVDRFNATTGFPIGAQAFRIAANARDRVTTQGFSIGGNYYFGKYFVGNANYSWNVLNTNTDDPIIPAFNTPEHKYNLGFSARDIPFGNPSAQMSLGFNTNYKWVDSFIFEGSPQFTGAIPSYGLLDAQVNCRFDKINTTIKIGASNLLDNQVFQTYGGPRIGRLAYASATFDLRKKI